MLKRLQFAMLFNFRSMMSCFVPQISGIKLQSCMKLGPNFDALGLPDFYGKGPQISDPIFTPRALLPNVTKRSI